MTASSSNGSEDHRRVTQKDVARHAGVSVSVVSYVLNNGPRSVAAETRQRVLAAIDELAYRPNKYARMLLRSKWRPEHAVRQFGVVLGGRPSMFTRPFYGAILAGIYEEAQRLQMRVRFLQFADELADPILFNELIHAEEISGLLLFAIDQAADASALVARVAQRIDNVVCLETAWPGLPAVIFDRAAAGALAVGHLLSLGHTRIGFVGAPDNRLVGYRSAHYEHGVAIDESLVVPNGGQGNTPEAGYAGALASMRGAPPRIAPPRSAPPPTALFACSDEVALGALAGLQSLGLAVPTEVALTSVDDIAYAAYTQPQLTTVRAPKAEMGAYAVRTLADRAQHFDSPPVCAVLPIELIVRESCGARYFVSQSAVQPQLSAVV